MSSRITYKGKSKEDLQNRRALRSSGTWLTFNCPTQPLFSFFSTEPTNEAVWIDTLFDKVMSKINRIQIGEGMKHHKGFPTK